MKQFLQLSFLLAFTIASSSMAWSDDLSQLEGKWSVKKTNDEGQAFTQTIEIKKDKFKFSIVGADDQVRLYAEGNVKLNKLGPFNSIQFINIKGGRSESEVQPVDDDRTSIYMIEGNEWTVASNFDKDRGSQKAGVDTYKKVQK